MAWRYGGWVLANFFGRNFFYEFFLGLKLLSQIGLMYGGGVFMGGGVSVRWGGGTFCRSVRGSVLFERDRGFWCVGDRRWFWGSVLPCFRILFLIIERIMGVVGVGTDLSGTAFLGVKSGFGGSGDGLMLATGVVVESNP